MNRPMASTLPSPEDHFNTCAPAWAWILQHSARIEKIAWAFVRRTSLDYEDFRGELIADLAAMFPAYDASRGGPGAWVWLRAQRVRRTMIRAKMREERKNKQSIGFLDDIVAHGHEPSIAAGQRGSRERFEASVEVVELLRRAHPVQVRAALSVLREAETEEIARKFGSRRRRDALVLSIRDLKPQE